MKIKLEITLDNDVITKDDRIIISNIKDLVDGLPFKRLTWDIDMNKDGLISTKYGTNKIDPEFTIPEFTIKDLNNGDMQPL